MPAIEKETEYLTRRKRIDPLLLSQGWKIVPFDPAVLWSQYTNHAGI